MENENVFIRICPSKELSDLRLDKMVGMTGSIVEKLDFRERKIKGYMVQLEAPFMGETVWFIPVNSIKYEE
ncbi:hypothetical protein [Bacteroides sp. 51]|uniref:hypothetical protein n=1 Tax=Bacteroides sp. 51 TaxID=2302938 RepID=UPI0013D11D0E|nr:hypothetical protein [Bacteroides sp. 51]NDV80866.1 hypothetical protein [Bacteroides sp. 51]